MAHFSSTDILNVVYGIIATISAFVIKWFISNFLRKSSKLESDRWANTTSRIKQNEDDIKNLTKELLVEQVSLHERLKALKEKVDGLNKKD